MVRARGQTPVAGRGPHDQIHRRLCDVFPISRGCRSRPGRLVQTAGKVRPDPGTDQDQARRIWPVRATTCRQTRQEAPRDDLFSGVHALLHAEPEGQLQDWDAHREISLAAQSHVVAAPTASNPALVDPGTSQRSQRRTEGHYAYYGIAGNFRSLQKVHRAVERYWHKMLCSRSWAGRITWDMFRQIKQRQPILRPKLYLPYRELQALAVL